MIIKYTYEKGVSYLGIAEMILIGLGLSMDAVAVSVTNGIVYKKQRLGRLLIASLFFGAFQGLMPILGFFTGNIFSSFMNKYSTFVVLLILGFIGAKMVMDGFVHKKEDDNVPKVMTFKLAIVQALATSIDAFAVGVTFSAASANIYLASGIIAVITLTLSSIATILGGRFGDFLGSKAEVFGGMILLFIAIKAII